MYSDTTNFLFTTYKNLNIFSQKNLKSRFFFYRKLSNRDENAFTLVELIVVTTILGFLLILIVPRFPGFKNQLEKNEISHMETQVANPKQIASPED